MQVDNRQVSTHGVASAASASPLNPRHTEEVKRRYPKLLRDDKAFAQRYKPIVESVVHHHGNVR